MGTWILELAPEFGRSPPFPPFPLVKHWILELAPDVGRSPPFPPFPLIKHWILELAPDFGRSRSITRNGLRLSGCIVLVQVPFK